VGCGIAKASCEPLAHFVSVAQYGYMADDVGWTSQYRAQVRSQISSEAERRQRQLEERQTAEQGAKTLRERNEAILAEYQGILAERIMHAYKLLVASGCPGTRVIKSKKKLGRSMRGWDIGPSSTGPLAFLCTDGTSPKWDVAAKKDRMRSIREVSTGALFTGYMVEGRMNWD
jgi:hypothetical protein